MVEVVVGGRIKFWPTFFNMVLHMYIKVKEKCSRYRPVVAQSVGIGIALLFYNHGTRRLEWSAARHGRTLPPGKTRYPLYRRLNVSQVFNHNP